MHRLLTGTLVLALAAVGCAGDTAEENDPMVGIWRTEAGWYQWLHSDGTWGIGVTPRFAQTDPWVWGTYAFDGNQLTLHTDAQSEICAAPDGDTDAGLVGIYDVTLSDDGTEQSLTVVDDPCSRRARITAPRLIRHSDPAGSNGATDPLVGLWRTPGGYYVLRAADSTLSLGYSAEGADSDPFGWGTYTFDEGAGVFTFTSGIGTECGANVTGNYEAEISQDGETATFTVVADPCTLRHNTMSGDQTRISPEP